MFDVLSQPVRLTERWPLCSGLVRSARAIALRHQGIAPGTTASLRNAVLVSPFTPAEEDMVRDEAPARQLPDCIRPNLTARPVYTVGETAHHIFPSQAGTVGGE